jgi:hypothetical protein
MSGTVALPPAFGIALGRLLPTGVVPASLPSAERLGQGREAR